MITIFLHEIDIHNCFKFRFLLTH